MPDLGNQAARLFTLNRNNCFGCRAKPAGICGESVASDWLAPGGVVVTVVTGRTLFLDGDPGMNCKNAFLYLLW
jgi:hypothetical protein